MGGNESGPVLGFDPAYAYSTPPSLPPSLSATLLYAMGTVEDDAHSHPSSYTPAVLRSFLGYKIVQVGAPREGRWEGGK
jgi:hypothetical protein